MSLRFISSTRLLNPVSSPPPLQMTVATNTSSPAVTPDSEMTAALKLVDGARKILECPVCYLPCPPPRIWQVDTI